MNTKLKKFGRFIESWLTLIEMILISQIVIAIGGVFLGHYLYLGDYAGIAFGMFLAFMIPFSCLLFLIFWRFRKYSQLIDYLLDRLDQADDLLKSIYHCTVK